MRQSVRKLARVSVASIALALLGACQSSLPAHYDGIEQEARNEVHMVRLAHKIDAAADDGLADRQKTNIIRFLAELDAGYGDSVTLVSGTRFPEPAFADLGRIIRAHGLALGADAASIGEEPDSNGAILVVDRYIVTSPQCPNSVLQMSKNYTNASSPQFGCANVINLGQMVANPRDLLTGNGNGRTSTGKAVQSLRAWREEVPIILVPQGADNGASGFGGSGGF
ncbi:hypothetical protein JCM17844_15980 [Iodidimonas gelatinilytica]|uniref:Pilus assembly protein CpaD n=1 Tax=Iodidimonas gelatinilytica TaxID=1236966 RepID=A0A5A7MPR8_9PROT|nr:CpaD family pilus assembly lipoprotein [Iodidimonas gelatinilytica]GEQ97961.1 hypothetical protein JCM17844_15980 [Iodidimonas gelatinilytica]